MKVTREHEFAGALAKKCENRMDMHEIGQTPTDS